MNFINPLHVTGGPGADPVSGKVDTGSPAGSLFRQEAQEGTAFLG